MKKVLLSLMAGALVFASNAQQVAQNEAMRATKVELPTLSETVSKVSNKKAVMANPFRKSEDALKVVDTKKEINALVAKAGSDVLEGTLLMKAMDYFSYSLPTWQVEVRKDASSDTYYFKDLLGTDADYEVAATLNGNTLTFELGQTVKAKNYESYSLVLAAVDASDELLTAGTITAAVDQEAGTITFTEGLGAKLSTAKSFVALYAAGSMALYTAESFPLIGEYTLPGAGFLYSLSYGLSMLRDYWVIAPPADWTYYSYVSGDAEQQTYEWNYSLFNVESETTTPQPTVDTRNLRISGIQEGDIYTVPTFKVTEGTKTSEYQAGMVGAVPATNPSLFYQNKYVQAGGGSTLASADGSDIFNLSIADLDYGLTYPMAGQGQYYFGTGTDVEEVITRYDNPGAPFFFYEVDVLTGIYDNPNNLPLSVAIIQVDETEEGYAFGDTLAVSSKFEYMSLGSDGMGWLQFYDFVSMDEDGLEVLLDSVAVNTGFAISLGNLNQEGLELCIATEEYQRPYNTNSSLITTVIEGQKRLTSWVDYGNRMYMNLLGFYQSAGASSVENVSANTTKLYTTSDAFNFTYTDDFTSMDVYNMNGQKVSSYALPQTGTFSIAKSALNDGVYMFRMNGKTTEVLRAVK